MENNQKKCFGIPFRRFRSCNIIRGGVFNLYSVLYGLLGALILGVTSGAKKRSCTSILCTIGIILLLAGIFGLYTFVYGLLGAVLIWMIAGSIKKYRGENNVEKTPS